MNNLLLIGGLGANDHSYWKLHHNVPDGWKLWLLVPTQLMRDCNLGKVSDCILLFLDENKLSKVSLAGHSLGGAIELQFAVDHPERVDKLYLVDSVGISSNKTFAQATASLLEDIFINKKRSTIERCVDMLECLRFPILSIRLAKLALHIDMEKQLKEVNIPIILIWGEKDLLVPLWQGEKMHQLIPKSNLKVLKDMDHHWILHSPELFWEQVK